MCVPSHIPWGLSWELRTWCPTEAKKHVTTVPPSPSIFNFFKWDMTLYFASTALWSLYSIFELRRTGYVTTFQALRAALVAVVAQVVVGPAAAYIGVWAWREEAIVKVTPLSQHADVDDAM